MNTARWALLVFLFLMLAACQPPAPPKLEGAGMDMFTPVKMRLHPLSRVAADVGSASGWGEARIEFTDQFGDIGKGAAKATFELYTYATVSLSHHGHLIEHWEFDITHPQENTQHWDAITRTYLFHLPLKNGAVSSRERVVLVATIELPNGQRFSDDLALDVK